jgi:tripartite-type tricarboxylate transporter receptor subunit TctC
VARLIGRELGARLSVAVIVDNRPGVAGIFGTHLIIKAAPDGYTIGMAQPALAVSKSLYAKLPYDAKRDLAPIILANESANVLAVHPSLPVRSVADLVALATNDVIGAAC